MIVFRLMFIAILFSVFIIKFALPSFHLYRDAGVFVDKHSIRRGVTASPAITFCALNRNNLGWKNDSIRPEDLFKPLQSICRNPASVEAALSCIDKETFNLTETVTSYSGVTLDMTSAVWSRHVSTFLPGRLFKLSFVQPVLKYVADRFIK